jgi:hypothetical protein
MANRKRLAKGSTGEAARRYKLYTLLYDTHSMIVSLLHVPGGGRGLRDAHACVLVRRHVAWKLVQCLCAREASSPGSLKPGMGGS